MPSPFPGMDPFIEDQKWSGFHHQMIAELGQRLVASLPPHYVVDPEQRTYQEEAAVQSTLPNSIRGPLEQRESYLVIRARNSLEIVTVIELLSPANKRLHSIGRKVYLHHRNDVLRTNAHLIELDLLLAGERWASDPPLPSADYCVALSRADQRSKVQVFPWSLSDRLPVIPVPLSLGEADARLDLQAALNAVYDQSGYDNSLRYDKPLEVPLVPEKAAWVQQVLAARQAS